jgi:hypothetical protein
VTTMKLMSVSIGKECGEVFGQADYAKNQRKYIAKINGKTIAIGIDFEDVREAIVKIFSPREVRNGKG